MQDAPLCVEVLQPLQDLQVRALLLQLSMERVRSVLYMVPCSQGWRLPARLAVVTP